MERERFRDRAEAGRLLADRLRHYAGRDDVIVLALPRGGVPVGYEVAKALGAPLDVFVVRKLGMPGYEELAMGAIASGGLIVLNPETLEALAISEADIHRAAAAAARAGAARGGPPGRPRPARRGGQDGHPRRRRSCHRRGDARRRARGRTVAPGARGGRRSGRGREDVRRLPRRRRRDRLQRDAEAVPRRRPLVRGLLTDDRRRGARSAPAPQQASRGAAMTARRRQARWSSPSSMPRSRQSSCRTRC
jgi:hypothetical protein